jgi:hypothetical protein
MQVKYTKSFLSKLEDLFAESSYILRYEKGNFQSGYCILKDTRVAVVNKYYPLEGKINALIDILRQVEIKAESLSPSNRKLLGEITQTEIKF